MDQTLSATKSKTWAVVLVITLVVVLGGAGAAWGFLRYSSSPEARILASFEKLSSVKTVTLAGSIEAKGEGPKVSKGFFENMNLNALHSPFNKEIEPVQPEPEEMVSQSMVFDFSGSMDFDPKNPKQSLTFGAVFKEGEVTFPKFFFDTMTKDKRMAFRFRNLPKISVIDLSPYDHQWMHLDSKRGEKNIPLFEDLISENARQKAELLEDKKKTERAIENMKRTAALSPPIKVTKRFRTEVVNGVKTYPYAITLNKKNVATILRAFGKYEKEHGVSKQEIEKFLKEDLNTIQKMDGTIWLGVKDGLPYRLKIAMEVTNPEAGQKPVQVFLSLDMKNYNQPVRVDLPVDSREFGEVVTEIFTKFSSRNLDSFATSTLPIADDFGKDTDKDGLLDKEESIYGTDKKNADTDGDGYLDGVEIKKGYDPLKKP